MAMLLPQKQKDREDKSFAQLMKEVAAESIGNAVGQGINLLGGMAGDAIKQSGIDAQNTAKFDILRNEAMDKEIARSGGGGPLTDIGFMKDVNLIGTPPDTPVPDGLVASRQAMTGAPSGGTPSAPGTTKAMNAVVDARMAHPAAPEAPQGILGTQPGPVGLRALPEASNPRLFRKVVDEKRVFTDPSIQKASMDLVADQANENDDLRNMALPTQQSLENVTGSNADALKRIALARMTPDQRAQAYGVMKDLRDATPSLANATTSSRNSIANLSDPGNALARAALESGKVTEDTRQEFGEYSRGIGGGGGGGGAGRREFNVPEAQKNFRNIQDEIDKAKTLLETLPPVITPEPGQEFPGGASFMPNPKRAAIEQRIRVLEGQAQDVNAEYRSNQGYSLGGAGLASPKGLAAGAVSEAKQPFDLAKIEAQKQAAISRLEAKFGLDVANPNTIRSQFVGVMKTEPMSEQDIQTKAEIMNLMRQAFPEVLGGM